MVTNYPQEFLLQNAKTSKKLNSVVEIEGYSNKFSSVDTYVTGNSGLEIDPSVFPYLSLNSGLILSQKTEPEQGRSSASTFSLDFLDVKGFMTNFISPNQQLDEVLGGRMVKIRMGYQDTSYPQDYFVVFRGYISDTIATPTKVMLQLTDANMKARSQIFFVGKTKLKQVVKNFTPAEVNIIDDKFLIAGHRLQDGMVIRFNTDTSLPSPITSGTDYYIVNSLVGSFQVSLTLGGFAENLTSTGSGILQFVLMDIGDSSTLLSFDDVSGFLSAIIGPDGTYDPSFTGSVIIDSEVLTYSQNAVDLSNNTIQVTRGQRGSGAATHSTTTDSQAAFILTGNLIDLALKTQLSGWGVPWISDQAIYSFGFTNDPDLGILTNALVLPEGSDAVEDYGLSVGDYLYIDSGPNAGTKIISGFLDSLGFTNKIILLTTDVIVEHPTTALFSTRSQFDTLPAGAGQSMRPVDLDVAAFQLAKIRYAFQADCTLEFFITSPVSLKTWIESELLLPVGAYSVTRFGRLSVAFTKPPLASQNLITLSAANVVNPQTLTVQRGLNSRKYFSEVQYYFDADVGGNFTSVLKRLASDAISKTKTSVVLPIQANGLRTSLSASTFIDRRAAYILARYRNAAYTIKMDVNFQAIAQIEASDVVAVVDQGGLQIANLDTGLRDLESQLFEVIERSLNLATGIGTLTLLSQIGYQITDRFGGISPSTLITGGSISVIEFKDSFGSAFPNNEYKKWIELIGERIAIHSPDYTFYEETTLYGFDAANKYKMLISPPLSTAPNAGWVIDCAKYPDNNTKTDQSITKLLYCSIDPTIEITGGTSTTVFDVDPLRGAEITSGLPVFVRNSDFSIVSSEAVVDTVVGSTVTLKTAIEFIPSAGQFIELIGFVDGLGPYREL